MLSALVARTADGWHVLVRHEPHDKKADAFLIGPSGVSAVVICEHPPDDATAQILLRQAEQRCAGIRSSRGQVLARTAVHLVAILPGAHDARSDGLYRALAEKDIDKLFRRDTTHLERREVEGIAEQARDRLPGYLPLRVSTTERTAEPAGLLDVEDLTEDQLAAAQQRSFESWMTFLHPQQQAVVTRNYNGPARISGPAGTGKTVVALHRLRHLARRSSGPLLFTTFVRTLPLVHQQSFHRLAPELGDRVEFTNLHAWARGFLSSRNKEVNLDSRRITTAFSLAWTVHRESLTDLEPTHSYWETEIDRVIKGRGLRTLEDYVKVTRKGRGVRLDSGQRERVWRLYQTYQHNLHDRGLHDYNDVLGMALTELRREPLETPYAAVVVDEVQDITLLGLRMLNELAGDGANRLLLVGDGQQQVYSGGWRLSDAGIPVQGRGEILRVNYRNRAKVLEFAQRFDATNRVDDLDGAAGVALRDVESANTGGTTRSWQGPELELPDALSAALRISPVPPGQTALIVFKQRDLDCVASILRKADVPFLDLKHYQGDDDGKVKIGTVHRAKGLDFQAVLVVQFGQDDAGGEAPEDEARELRGRQHLVAATRARDFLWWGVVESPER
ncbi:UvrD-helicase domain-containing protein [Allokutzneria oryzae]|uniref:UvrD-helicase domain-containing protein n=1 Tax=Allokutzneria oryzae TaxID=1378989 RepID=A0ABV6A8H8_9PSEU